ncbi:MAG TPA: outer membrane beta-barrel protein [Xanthobacteraceae bacterium]|jgi:outer membrane immunogenic protein
MKNLITAMAGLAALVAGPALAAEMPVKAVAPPAPPPVVTWTGGYVGLGLGGMWASTKWTTTCFDDSALFPGTGTNFGTCLNPDPDFDVIDSSGSHRFNSSGFRPSLYGGWNLQTGNAVVGLEFDLGYENQKNSLAGIPGCIISTLCAADGESTWVRMDVDGSIRARFGFLVPLGVPAYSAMAAELPVKAGPAPVYEPPPQVLIYGTGGLAFQSFRTNVNCVVPTIGGGFPGFNCADTLGSRQTESAVGWTIGGGLEYKSGQFVYRGEYRFSDYGNTDVSFFPPAAGVAQGINARLHLTTQIAYFGISYLWGPVVRGGGGGGGGGLGGAGE